MKKHGIKITAFFLLVICLFLTLIPLTGKKAFSATKAWITEKDLTAGRQFALADMPTKKISPITPVNYSGSVIYENVQNFCYTPDGKYILVTGPATAGGTTHGFLARCRIPKAGSANPQAVCEEVLILNNYGHNDSIAVTQPNRSSETYNVWLSCKAGSNGYGTQIARVTYQIGKNGIGRIAKTVYLSNFKRANTKKGKAARFANKSEIANLQVAVDESSNQIVFRLVLLKDYSVHYLSYNLKRLNALLNRQNNNQSYNIAKASGKQIAHIRCGINPLLSFQSFAVSGKCLYIAGGKTGIGAEIDLVKYKTQKKGKVKEQNKDRSSAVKKVISIEPKVWIQDEWYDRYYLEIEGLKVQKGANGTMNYYMSFCCAIPRANTFISIYKVTK